MVFTTLAAAPEVISCYVALSRHTGFNEAQLMVTNFSYYNRVVYYGPIQHRFH